MAGGFNAFFFFPGLITNGYPGSNPDPVMASRALRILGR